LLRPQGRREELVKALPRELVKAPLREPIQYTQVTQKRVLIGVVRATWTTATATRQRRDGDQTAQRGGNTGKALGSGNTGQLRRPYGVKGDSQEGLNRRGARNLTHAYKATYRRVLIGVVHAT
jgi:hypothetical protein